MTPAEARRVGAAAVAFALVALAVAVPTTEVRFGDPVALAVPLVSAGLAAVVSLRLWRLPRRELLALVGAAVAAAVTFAVARALVVGDGVSPALVIAILLFLALAYASVRDGIVLNGVRSTVAGRTAGFEARLAALRGRGDFLARIGTSPVTVALAVGVATWVGAARLAAEAFPDPLALGLPCVLLALLVLVSLGTARPRNLARALTPAAALAAAVLVTAAAGRGGPIPLLVLAAFAAPGAAAVILAVAPRPRRPPVPIEDEAELTRLRSALEANADDSMARLGLAQLLARNGDRTGALREAIAAAETGFREIGDVLLLFLEGLGHRAFQHHDYRACVETFAWYVHLRFLADGRGYTWPGWPRGDQAAVWSELVVARAVCGEWDAVLATSRERHEESSNENDVRRWLVVAAGATGGDDAAAAAWASVYPEGSSPDSRDLVHAGLAEVAERAERAGMGAEALAHWTSYYRQRTFFRGERLGSGLTGEEQTLRRIFTAYRGLALPPPLPHAAAEAARRAERHAEAGRADDVVTAYGEALDHAPWWPEGYYDLGLVYAAKDDLYAASRCMGYYLELEPDGPQARRARKQLDRWLAKTRR